MTCSTGVLVSLNQRVLVDGGQEARGCERVGTQGPDARVIAAAVMCLYSESKLDHLCLFSVSLLISFLYLLPKRLDSLNGIGEIHTLCPE